MKNKLLKVTGVCFLLLLGIFLGVYGITYITKASTPASYGLYVNESLATAINGKTYTWSKNSDSAKITDAAGNKIYTTSAGTQSDANFEYNSTSNSMYVNWGYPEFTTIGYQKDAVQGIEMILTNSVTVKDYATFTFEIGMKTSNALTYLYGSQEDFNCKVYFYGKNESGENVSIEVKNISYGVGSYKTAIVSLKDIELTTIERVGLRFNNSPQGTTDYTALQNDSATKPMLANFRFNVKTEKVGEVVLKANDLDVQFYNGAGLSGVLNGKRASRTYNRQIAYGQDTDTVADSEYKYTTSCISVGNHVIYMLEEPINIRDYDKLTLELLAWPQVAEGTYLKETATEYTYTILPYNASENENGLNFTLKARKWTDCVIPLEQFADDEGYVSKFIILYSANNAEGHELDDQNKYSINIALHDSVLESAPTNTSHGLYVNQDLAKTTGGNSYQWSTSKDASKVLDEQNEKIYTGRIDTRSDKNYRFNVKECNSTDNIYYMTYGFPEINLVNYVKDTTAGHEMILSEPIHVKYFNTFTFEIGMKVNKDTYHHGANKDFGCKIYFYGTDQNGKNISVKVKEISYGVGFYTTVTVDLAQTNLTKIERVAYMFDYSTSGNEDYSNLSESGAGTKTMLANFRFNEKSVMNTDISLKANDRDVLFYNGAAMGGVLEGKASTPIFWTNGASAAFGISPVDNTEYKYMTTRISTGSYVVYMFKEPVKAADYKDLTLQLLAWPQGADANQGYLKETATEFTYTILPYNATRNEGGLNFTVAAKTWTDCVIPLEQFADEDGYVSKLIILYSTNNADGHTTDDQSKYTINFALHDSRLGEVKEVEETPIPEGTMDTSFGLYVKEELATQTAGKTYKWSTLDESKVLNKEGKKVNKINQMDTRSDNNYRFNVRECNSKDNAYYVAFGFLEINLINYEEDTTKGCEMIFAEAVKVKNFSTFTFEIGMRLADDAKHERRGSNKDFKCTVYAYGSNGTEKVSVPIKEVSYGLDFYTTVVVELEKTGLKSIERIAFELPFDSTNTKGYPELTGKDKVILADFKFNDGLEKKPELLLKANNLDVLFYNGGLMAGVLENKAPTSIFWTNGASAAFGLSPVDNTEYKYMTTRISTGTYMVYMLKEPVNIKDYHNLTLKLLAWPQGADEKQGYLKETATEFTYSILPYNAAKNSGGLQFTLSARQWTDCKIPLEMFADEDGYVSKFIILYAGNNAEGHTVKDQSKYTMNFALYDSVLDNIDQTEMVFTYIEKPIITETKISFRLKSTTMFGAGEKLTDSLAESISINGKTIKSLINEKKVAIKLNGNFVEVVLNKSEFMFDDTDCIEIKKGATVKTYKNGRKLINTDDEKFVYSTTLERFEVDVDWEQVKNNSKRGAIEQIEIAQNAESVFNGETLKMSSVWVHFKDGAKKNYDTFNVHLNLQEFAKASGCSDLLTYHYAQNGMFESVMDKMVVNGKSLREWLIEDKQAGNSGMIRVEYLPFSISQGKIMRIVVSEKSLLKIGEGVDQSIEFKEGFTNPNLQQIPDNTYFEISATEAIANAKFSNINPNDVEIQNVDMEFEQDKTESVSWFAKYGIAVTISGITLIVVIGVIAFWLFRKKRGEC